MKQITGRYKIVLILLILYVVLMAVIFGPSLFISHEEIYLLVGSTAKWKYDGEKWSDIEEGEKNLYSWEAYDVYIDQKKFGNYQVVFSENKWYLFDSSKQPVNYNGAFLGVKTKGKYQVASFVKEDFEESDATYLNEVYEKHHLKPNQPYTEGYKVSFDLDQDEEEETLYVVTNQFPDTFAPATIFNFVFVVDNENIKMIYEQTGSFTKMYDYCKIRLDYLIDVDHNGKYEIILNCGYFSTMGNCTSMYAQQGADYQPIKTCNT